MSCVFDSKRFPTFCNGNEIRQQFLEFVLGLLFFVETAHARRGCQRGSGKDDRLHFSNTCLLHIFTKMDAERKSLGAVFKRRERIRASKATPNNFPKSDGFQECSLLQKNRQLTRNDPRNVAKWISVSPARVCAQRTE